MVVSEFEKILRDAAETRHADWMKQSNLGGPAVGLCFSNWLESSAEGGHAQRHGMPDQFLHEYLSLRPDALSKDQPLTLEDLKQRIQAGLSKEQASALRRQFAIHSHPDRSDEAGREAATDLMAQANDLLDQVSRRRAHRS